MSGPEPWATLGQEVMETTASLVDEFGPRLSTTKPCQDCAQALHRRLQSTCDRAFAEDFVTTPFGMPNLLRFIVAMYLISLLFLLFDRPMAALLVEIFTAFTYTVEFLFYIELFDALTPKRTATNVYGVMDPTDEVRNIVIFSGHHDSAHIFNFFLDGAFWFMKREIALLVVQAAYFISLVLLNVLGTQRLWPAKVVFVLAIRIVFPFWYFMNNSKGTPGAGDNLVSSVMGCVLAKYYSGRPRLKHTQLYFISFDAEELMLKGSRAFFRRHKFREAKTWNFNVDCPYCPDDIKFLSRDVNGFVTLSKRLCQKLAHIAHDLGYKGATLAAIPFNNGGTDAGEAARIGIEATTLIAMSFTPYNSRGKLQVYHTPDDTIHHIFPDALVATMSIFAKFVEEIDSGRWPDK
jgi:hypothetical protein